MHHSMGDGVSLATVTMKMSDNLFQNPKEQLKKKRKFCGCCFQFFFLLKILLWILFGFPLVIFKYLSVLLFSSNNSELFSK